MKNKLKKIEPIVSKFDVKKHIFYRLLHSEVRVKICLHIEFCLQNDKKSHKFALNRDRDYLFPIFCELFTLHLHQT